MDLSKNPTKRKLIEVDDDSYDEECGNPQKKINKSKLYSAMAEISMVKTTIGPKLKQGRVAGIA